MSKRIFDIVDNKVVITPESLEIPEFKTIWDKDKDKGKINAFKDFKYIKYVCDPEGPYSSVSADKRDFAISKDVYGDEKYKISEDVKIAIEKYSFLNVTSLQRLLRAATDKMDEVTTFLNTTKFDVESAKTINDVYKNISTYVDNEAKLKSAVEKEKNSSMERRRAGKKTNKYED